jgi:DNA-binding MarR family transcriptional regulator
MDNDPLLKQCSLAMSKWLEMSMHISFKSHFMFFKEKGFSHSQISTLHMLYHKDKCAVNDVGHMQSISNPAASQLLDQLVKRGLVERYEASEDRRVKYHKLTEAGIKMMKKSHSVRKNWYRSLVNELSDDELVKVTEALEILNKKIHIFNPVHEGCNRGDNN